MSANLESGALRAGSSSEVHRLDVGLSMRTVWGLILILMNGRRELGRVTTEKLEGSGGEFGEPVHLGDEHGLFFVGAVAGGIVEQFLGQLHVFEYVQRAERPAAGHGCVVVVQGSVGVPRLPEPLDRGRLIERHVDLAEEVPGWRCAHTPARYTR